MISKRSSLLFFGGVLLVLASPAVADDVVTKSIRLGIIGLDTSHVIAFTEYLNDPANATGCKVVAAYPGGSSDLSLSANRLAGFTNELREKFNVEIVDQIETLCQKVDGVLLESVDGRVHLEQFKKVVAAKKPVFIDKPVANELADAIEIYRLAKEACVPCWSSSDWRFAGGVSKVQNGEVGNVIGCVAYGPCPLLPPFPGLYWYGIHTVEALFALMGPGCESVSRTNSDTADVVVGLWKDGRIGVFRGARHADAGGGFLVFGAKGIQSGRLDNGYGGLLKKIVAFFRTGKVPVLPEQTLEVLAFMTAADVSKARGGICVRLDEVTQDAETKNRTRHSTDETKRLNRKLRIVFFGAHCDDNELGAGGLMRMLADEGHEVISAYATAFRRGRRIDGKPEDEVRRAESATACKILGAVPYFFPYAHEDLEKPFAEKQTLIDIGRWLDQAHPDIVVTHWPLDTHSNHQVVGMSTWMAYDHLGRIWGTDETKSKKQKGWNLYFYEVNTFTKNEDLESLAFHPTCYLDVGKVRDMKERAVECLKSQNPAELWAVHDKMQVERGKECGVRYAEAFFLVEAKPGCPLLPVPLIKQP